MKMKLGLLGHRSGRTTQSFGRTTIVHDNHIHRPCLGHAHRRSSIGTLDLKASRSGHL